MKKTLRKGILILLVLVFMGSGAMVLRQFRIYSAAEKLQAEAQEISKTQEPVELPAEQVPLVEEPEEPLDESLAFLLETDLAALRETNEDVLGWICIPDTQLSYPLLQAEDNEYYLNRAWDKTPNSAGSIYLECMSSPDLSDFNTIVYGHRMKNGSMFGSLREYRDQTWLEAHPSVYIVTDGELLRYDIFSAYEASVVSDTYRLYVKDEAVKQAALEHFTASSVLESPLVPTTEDQILTLSTCTGTGTYHTRWVVQAVLAARWER